MELLFSGMGTEVKRDNGQYQGSPHFVHPDNRFQLQKPIRNIRKEVSRAVIDTAHYYRRPIENSWIFDALGSKVPWNFPPTFRQASKIRLSTISLFFSILFFFFLPDISMTFQSSTRRNYSSLDWIRFDLDVDQYFE